MILVDYEKVVWCNWGGDYVCIWDAGGLFVCSSR